MISGQRIINTVQLLGSVVHHSPANISHYNSFKSYFMHLIPKVVHNFSNAVAHGITDHYGMHLII